MSNDAYFGPPRPSDKAARDLRERCEADMRVWKLMDIICTEWRSDPMSVKCFDLRIVDECQALVAKRKKMSDPFNPFSAELLARGGGNL